MATTKAKGAKATSKASTSSKAGKLSGAFAVPVAPKRTAVDEAKARAFVEKGTPAKASTSTASTADSKLRRDERGERVSGYLPPDLAEALRVYCARERCSTSHALTEAVRTMLRA
jgi:hypothetical protein